MNESQFTSINILGHFKLRSSITYPKHIASTRVSDSAILYLATLFQYSVPIPHYCRLIFYIEYEFAYIPNICICV